MKLKKLFSFAAATVVAASVAAATASADWAPVPDAVGGLSSATGLYMVPIFCNADSGEIPPTDYNIDLSKIGSVAFTMQVQEADREFFDGAFGGGVGVSIHAKTIEKIETPEDKDKTYETPDGKKVTAWDYYNWDNSKQYWGVVDREAKNPMAYDLDGEYIEGEMPVLVTYGDDKPAFLETLGAYTYRIKTDIVNPVVDGVCKAEDITDIRVFLQCWNSSAFKADITRTVIFDTDGKVMLAFDSKGNKVDGTADDEKEPVKPVKPAEGEIIPPITSGDTSAADSTAASTATSSANSTADSAATSSAASSAPANSAANSADSTASATSTASTSSGLPTGVGIAIGVVVVIVVVVVIIVVKKKKG